MHKTRAWEERTGGGDLPGVLHRPVGARRRKMARVRLKEMSKRKNGNMDKSQERVSQPQETAHICAGPATMSAPRRH